MQVYVELAFIENFCMDFTLLYCAKAASRNRAKLWRLALASAFGGASAIAFTLLPLGKIWGTVVKIALGFLIALIACKFTSFKGYLKFSCAFVGFTFLLGGALTAIFSLAGADMKSGDYYILSSVPIGVPAFGALMLVLFARYLARRLKKTDKNLVRLLITTGDERIELPAFFDSGNSVYFRGEPVSVVPPSVGKRVAAERIKGEVKIHTVAGSRTIKVFTAEKVTIYSANSQKILRNVIIGISGEKIDRAVLHPDLLED